MVALFEIFTSIIKARMYTWKRDYTIRSHSTFHYVIRSDSTVPLGRYGRTTVIVASVTAQMSYMNAPKVPQRHRDLTIHIDSVNHGDSVILKDFTAICRISGSAIHRSIHVDSVIRMPSTIHGDSNIRGESRIRTNSTIHRDFMIRRNSTVPGDQSADGCGWID